ncbi:tripartite tricarboxylate transporter substrate binding protein, partial [Bordetella hinzii]|nr:tripartite tricarboxylate transporter substrate binding protein [Bordetella hinzii]
RVSFMPGIPAIAETPPFGDLDISVWFGLFAPQGLPQDVKETFEKAVTATMADPAVQKEFRDRYYEIEKTGSAAMAEQIGKDLSMYDALSKQSGITLE